ncbi:MAG: IS1595 family transposase [Gammaproteobacteria bacterium]|nr:IS1595 family transposase [Gammaproteobacteria bacterium]
MNNIVLIAPLISSYQLAKELGITQKSSWFMGHRIRKACKNNAVILSGMIEIDETYIGGRGKNKHQHKKTKGTQGRSTKTKTPVVGMCARNGKTIAVKMDKVNSANIQTMIDNHADNNATLCTDEATIYKGIEGYKQLMALRVFRHY